MGGCQSKSEKADGASPAADDPKEGNAVPTPAAAPDPVLAAAPAAPASAGTTDTPVEKPTPKIFAVMRNAHEVLRGAGLECTAALNLESDVASTFMLAWADFVKFQNIHASMEDGVPGVCDGLFAMLDEKCDGVATKSGLREAHAKLHAAEDAVDAALKAGELAGIKSAHAAFAEENEVHLKDEESVMMPKVMELVKAGESLKELMTTRILPAALAADFDFFIGFAMRTLEKYEEAAGDGMPKTRVFAHALKGLATDEQWPAWRKVIKESLSAAKYDAIDKEVGGL